MTEVRVNVKLAENVVVAAEVRDHILIDVYVSVICN